MTKYFDRTFESSRYSFRVLDTLLFANGQVIFSSLEDGLQMAAHKLEQATRKCNLKFSTTNTKSMGFQEKEYVRTKIVMDGKNNRSSVRFQLPRVEYILL